MTTATDNAATPPAASPTTPAPSAASGTNEIDSLKAQLATLGEDVAHMAGLVLADVPEKFKPLIPDGLSPAAQAAWVLKARKAGVFGPAPVPPTDGGKKPTITPTTPDFNSLPATARIAAGYRK